MSGTFKLIVPEEVEAKIRYLIRKFPNTEWSGVLFTEHTGSFEARNLVITCKDIYPMAAGTSGWTEFDMTEDVAAYVTQNIELFNCDIGLVHSHHTMGAFFSGQDLHTLQDQGNDKNCFISLIVDTRGRYVAAITRKVKTLKEVKTTIKDSSYMYFGERRVHLPTGKPETQEVEEKAIEYYMLDVERHTVEEPLAYLDERFEEIEAKNRPTPSNGLAKGFSGFKDEKGQPVQADLFGAVPDRGRHYIVSNADWVDEKDVCTHDPIEVDSKLLKEAATRILCCSLIVSADKIDLKQWVTRNMERVYAKLFGDMSGPYMPYYFASYAEWVIEWTLDFIQDGMRTDPWTDPGYVQASIAHQLKAELTSYGSNRCIEHYCKLLDSYI